MSVTSIIINKEGVEGERMNEINGNQIIDRLIAEDRVDFYGHHICSFEARHSSGKDELKFLTTIIAIHGVLVMIR